MLITNVYVPSLSKFTLFAGLDIGLIGVVTTGAFTGADENFSRI